MSNWPEDLHKQYLVVLDERDRLQERVDELEAAGDVIAGEARAAIRRVDEIVTGLTASTRALQSHATALERRLADIEERSRLYEQRATENAEAAELLVEIEKRARKLLEQLDRLPVRMADAGVIPGATQEIALYGTYDWQNVMEAKFKLAEKLKDG